MTSPDTINALVIYEDRVQTYRLMKVLDDRIEQAPCTEDIRDLAELRIRNLLCFRELQHLNDKGCFLNIHPILQDKLEYAALLKMWHTDRDAFVRNYENCRNNVRRYRGIINRPSISDVKKEEALILKNKHMMREQLFKKILNNEPINNCI